MTHALITGATGFIGRRLCRKLLADGVSVVAAVRTPRQDASVASHAAQIVIGDIATFDSWPDVLRNVDTVIHLAARAHIIRETEEAPWDRFCRVNVDGTRRLLRACLDAPVRRFVYLSSIGVIGRGGNTAYRENDPCRPEDLYAKSKLKGERLTIAANSEGALETVVLRAPLVYGPGVEGNFLRIMNLVRRGVPLPLGLLKNARSILFLENLIDAISLAATHPDAPGEVFHVADQHPVSTPELAQMLASCYRQRTLLLPIPVRAMEFAGRLIGRQIDVDRLVRSLTVSTEKIEHTLGWKPLVATSTGVRLTVEQSMGRPPVTRRTSRLPRSCCVTAVQIPGENSHVDAA